MSTRANIVIKKGNDFQQMYHHHDGYPSGVGIELQEFTQEILRDEKKDELLQSPLSLAQALAKMDNSYELEDTLNLHSDIEYLYVIDMDMEVVYCYSVENWDYNSDMYMIYGIAPRKYQVKVYSLEFGHIPTDEMIDKYEKVCVWNN